MSTRIRTRALAAILAVTTGALILIAAPAQADTKKDADGACWLDTSTDVTLCFDDEAALQDAVADSGHYLVEEGDDLAARGPAGLLASFVLVRFYDGAGYTSTTFVITNPSSTICASSSVSGNLPAFNDRVSSYHSYFGCTTKIFENNGGGGASFGYAVDAPGVGALNNLASSYNIT
ncbi:MAG: hypothetical protein ABL886_13305 [Rhodoglobus sp.]